MGEGSKTRRMLGCALLLLLSSQACAGSWRTTAVRCRACADHASVGFFLNVPFTLFLFFFPLFLLLPSFIRRTKGKFLWESEVTAMIIEFTTQKKKKVSLHLYFSICILWALPKVHLHSLHLLDARSVYSNKVEKENASLKQRKSGNFFFSF